MSARDTPSPAEAADFWKNRCQNLECSLVQFREKVVNIRGGIVKDVSGGSGRRKFFLLDIMFIVNI